MSTRFQFNKPQITVTEPQNIATPVPSVDPSVLASATRPSIADVLNEPIERERPDLIAEVPNLDRYFDKYPVIQVLVNNYVRARETEERIDDTLAMATEMVIQDDNDMFHNACDHPTAEAIEELTGDCNLTPCGFRCIVKLATKDVDRAVKVTPPVAVSESRVSNLVKTIKPINFGLFFLILLIKLILAFAITLASGLVCKLICRIRDRIKNIPIIQALVPLLNKAKDGIRGATSFVVELLGFICKGDEEERSRCTEDEQSGEIVIALDCCPCDEKDKDLSDNLTQIIDSRCFQKAIKARLRNTRGRVDNRPICGRHRCRDNHKIPDDYGAHEIALAQQIVIAVSRQTKKSPLLGTIETLAAARKQARQAITAFKSMDAAFAPAKFPDTQAQDRYVSEMVAGIQPVQRCNSAERIAEFLLPGILRSQVVLVEQNPDLFLNAVEERIGAARNLVRDIGSLAQDVFEFVQDPAGKFRSEVLAEAANAIREVRLRFEGFVDNVPDIPGLPGLVELFNVRDRLRGLEDTLRNG